MVGRRCSVTGCKNNSIKNPDLHFYTFPNRLIHTNRKQFWIDFCRRPAINGNPWTTKASSFICSSHFVGGKKVNEAGHPSYNPSLYGSSQFDHEPTDDSNEVAKDETTIVSDNSRSVVSCGLCQQSFLIQDGEKPTSSKRKLLPEESAVARLTRMLGISTESVLQCIVGKRGQFDCPFCNCCNEVIDRGLTLMKKIKTLQTQLKNLKQSVIKQLRRDAPRSTTQFEPVKKALGKCFQQCSVHVFDAGGTDDYHLPRKKARLHKGEDVSTSTICTSGEQAEEAPGVVIKRDRDEEEEAFRVASPEAECGGSLEANWEAFDNSELQYAEEGGHESSQACEQVESHISVETGVTDSCVKGRRSQRTRKYTAKGKAMKLHSIDGKDTEGDVRCRSCGDSFENRRLLAKHYWSIHGSSDTSSKRGKASPVCDRAEWQETDVDSEWDAAQTSTQESCGESSDSDFLSDSESRKRPIKRKKPLRVLKKQEKPTSEEEGNEDENDGGDDTMVKEVFCLEELKCFFCDVAYPAIVFGDHIQRCHGLKYYFGIYACLQCGDICTSETVKDFYLQHSGCGTLNSDFKCQLCYQNFESLSQKLQHHRLTHFDSSTCSICGQSFETLSYLLWHQNRTYEFLRMVLPESVIRSYDSIGPMGEGTGYSRQIVVGEDLSSSAQPALDLNGISSKDHQNSVLPAVSDSHNGQVAAKTLLQCDICYEWCDTLAEYYTHHEMHNITLTTLGIQCRKCCDIVFLDETKAVGQFYRHHLECETSSVQITDCLYCSSTFDTAEENINHYYFNHQDCVRCQVCAAPLYIKSLSSHLRDHHSLKVTYLAKQCRKCGKVESGITSRQLKEFCDVHAQCETVLQPPSRKHFSFSYVFKMAECFFCCSRFSSIEDLRAHEFDAHQLSPVVSTYKSNHKNHEDKDMSQNVARKFSKIMFHMPHFQASMPPLKCGVCHQFLRSSLLFKAHMEKVHPGSDVPYVSKRNHVPLHKLLDTLDKFRCRACNLTFYSESEISEHNQQHVAEDTEGCQLLDAEKLPAGGQSTGTSTNSKLCAICDFNFLSQDELKFHLFTEHNLVSHLAEYGCKTCGSIFTGSTENVLAMQAFGKAHESCQRIFENTCSFSNCGYMENNLFKKLHHFYRLHRWRGAYGCLYCGKTFPSSTKLRFHMRLHNWDSAPRAKCYSALADDAQNVSTYFCTICKMPSVNESVFQQHLRELHQIRYQQGILSCGKCLEIFVEDSSSTFAEFTSCHMNCESIQPSEAHRKGYCRKCDIAFFEKKSLLDHFFQCHYTGPKIFCCDMCKASFARHRYLEAHYEAVHSQTLQSLPLKTEMVSFKLGYSYPSLLGGNENNNSSKSIENSRVSTTEPVTTKEVQQGYLECRICGFLCPETKLKTFLKIHVREVHHMKLIVKPNVDYYCCNSCQQFCHVNEDETALANFFQDHGKQCIAPENSVYQCKVCLHVYSLQGQVIEHHYTRHLPKSRICNICGSGFKRDSTLLSHMKVHLAADGREVNSSAGVTCKLCLENVGPTTKTQISTTARQHYKSKHSLLISRGHFVCSKCFIMKNPNDGTSLADFVSSHANCPQTPEVGQKYCTQCSYSTQRLSAYLQHQDYHFKRFICEECGRTYPTLHDMERHSILHKNPSIFKCTGCAVPGCTAVYQEYNAWRLHIKGRVNVCEKCGYGFHSIADLKRHMTTHDRILNVKCDMCDKMFWNRTNMRSHIREFHLKKRKDRWKNKKKSLLEKEQDVEPDDSR